MTFSVNVLCHTPALEFVEEDDFVRIVRLNSGVVHTSLVTSQALRFSSIRTLLERTQSEDLKVA